MVRFLLPVLLIILLFSLPVQASSQDVKVIVNGGELNLEPSAFLQGGHVFVPIRSFLTILGGEVLWQGEDRQVIGRWGDVELILPLESTKGIVNGEERELTVPLKVIAGCTYVPIRFIAESLDGDLKWEGQLQTVSLEIPLPEALSTNSSSDSIGAIGEEEALTKININSASVSQLQTIPGLDESLAKAIVEYRELEGPYRNMGDLLKVPDIDEQVVAILQDKVTVIYEERGMASWYGAEFHGRPTASGEIFNQDELTAAHPELPFGTYVRVLCFPTGKEAVVRINDRGPHVPGRIIDLSRGAADAIGLRPYGVAEVVVSVMGEQSL